MSDFQQLLGENSIIDERTDKKPKRPPNAFNLFYVDQLPKIKLDFPELNGAEISKLLGEKWKKMSKEEKKVYQEQAQQIHHQFKIDNPDFHYEKGENAKSKKKKTLQDESTMIKKSLIKTIEPYIFWVGAHALNQYLLNNKNVAQLYEQKVSQKIDIPINLE